MDVLIFSIVLLTAGILCIKLVTRGVYILIGWINAMKKTDEIDFSNYLFKIKNISQIDILDEIVYKDTIWKVITIHLNFDKINGEKYILDLIDHSGENKVSATMSLKANVMVRVQ